MSKQVISLQSKLVKSSVLSSVLAGGLALILLLAVASYQTMQVHDEIMDEIADMLLRADLRDHAGNQVDELSEQFHIAYQLGLDDLILTTSEDEQDIPPLHLPQLAVASEHGFSFHWQDGQIWRNYVAEEDGLHVIVVQPIKYRFKEIAATSLGYAAILLLLWLLQWAIVHFMIGRQFKRIQQLSQQIAEKNQHDLTPIIPTQPELKELQPMLQQLNKLLGRVEQSLIAEQRFTADASHELRSPLSAIQLRLQVLKRKYQQQPELAQDLEQIQRDVNRGTQVLENLLLLARLDPTDAVSLNKSTVSIADLVQEVLQSLTPFIQEKAIQIHLDVQEIQVQGNPELLFSCLRNLIDNAVRYTAPQGRIWIEAKPYELMQEICIADNGQAVTDEVLARLGERFYRALGSKTQGSGLGLSICKKIIELHAGKIEFSRAEQGGLKVRILLPKAQL